jgi:hypothetical protein
MIPSVPDAYSFVGFVVLHKYCAPIFKKNVRCKGTVARDFFGLSLYENQYPSAQIQFFFLSRK